MTENEAQCRVTFSEELLQAVRHAQDTDFEHLLTGNESWFYYKHPHDLTWAPSRATLPTRKVQKIQTKKRLVSIIWSTSGIQILLALTAGMRHNTELFYVSVLLDIERNLCDGKRRKTVRGIYLHLDNAPTHNTKRSRQEIGRTKATRVVHPAYSPGTAPSDFFLFGYMKGEMAGLTANSLANIISEIRRVFQEISKETLLAVYCEWIVWIEWITKHKGKYCHTE
jgi:hypothetical protein